ncbi:tyrosine-type recombinase/integrase [Pisciglobus halotolerans]|uniref:AP2-like DNA-binding integrase domain-containing protein n=1 Tax=Pisciglobus halotolerans TaxID=745365 RepID=A0A1I3BJB4_9LACT|nr:tyrosine-type recombinase/integrase [Pisciglobus halotolerans]SFH62353.1 AP2-like DNA-binding integrase domain-containing protein [Pisciglobus halotolerans]
MASYRKLKSGWQYRITYKDNNGKPKERSKAGFKTKAEAKINAEKVEKQLNKQLRNQTLLDPETSFYGYFCNWYEVYKEPHISEITQMVYSVTKNIINKHFGNQQLTFLSTDQYQKFINQYGKNHSIETVKRHHNHMKACLDHAYHSGHTLTDITYKVKLVGKAGKQEDMKYLNQSEAKDLTRDLLEGYNGSQTSRAMILFALSTGCRLGEVMALTEDCIDRENMLIHVKRSWDYKKNHTFVPTKTNSSERKIAIDTKTIAIVDKHINYYKKLALKTGQRNVRNLVFTGKDFLPISSTGANKALKRACERIHAQTITFHGLRHTHASMMLLNGSDIFFVSKRLGHSSTLVTAEVYAHVLKEMEDKGNEQVNALANEMYQ